MTTLIVQLPPRNTAIQAAQWQLGALPFALFDRRARMLRAGCATLTLLPRAQTTILLTAARDLLLLSVPLAPLSKARLRAVLPNVVEDQLAQDAQSCHIALEPTRRGNPHPDPSQRARAGLPSSTGTGSGLYTWLLLKRAISDYARRLSPVACPMPKRTARRPPGAYSHMIPPRRIPGRH